MMSTMRSMILQWMKRAVMPAAGAIAMIAASPAFAQNAPTAEPLLTVPSAQPQDAEYTALIAEHLVDKRITTDLVDHMPASATVPSPLKFFGRIPGTPGELTYGRDIQCYYEELARTSPRVRLFKWTCNGFAPVT